MADRTDFPLKCDEPKKNRAQGRGFSGADAGSAGRTGQDCALGISFSSTRRLASRPLAVSFDATGFCSP